MAIVKPFPCLRPVPALAGRVAALPYDVYSRAEAREVTKEEPISFLNIDRPETQFSPDTDMYSRPVYERAAALIREWEGKGIFVRDDAPCFYLWEETMEGRSQTGIVGCSAVDDYLSGVICRHENTRRDKEEDRIRHIDITGAQTGPIFLAFRDSEDIRVLMEAEKKKDCLYCFATKEGVLHRVWRIADPDICRQFTEGFAALPHTYIADGHHRAASAVEVAKMRREKAAVQTGEEPYQTFLSVLFPQSELRIMDYNRVVKDLNGRTSEAFLSELEKEWVVTHVANAREAKPVKKLHMGMYLDGQWYTLSPRVSMMTGDAVEDLDVSILQNRVLAPLLGISDPRTDERIGFIGGIRGLRELERRCSLDMKVAFAMYPTSMEELFSVADEGRLMPPKSTWFEPKLLSGLFIHEIG